MLDFFGSCIFKAIELMFALFLFACLLVCFFACCQYISNIIKLIFMKVCGKFDYIPRINSLKCC